jgi:quercetin dioxygenase-like cupin family protein
MKVSRTSEIPEVPAQSPLFTGEAVTRQVLTPPEITTNLNCAIVNFGRGIRNKFHTHTSDQVLVITSGTGTVATEQEEREVTVGDVILIPAGEKHWHGARKESYMSHITVMAKDSKTTQLED